MEKNQDISNLAVPKPLTVGELKLLLENAPDDGIVYISGTGLGHVDVVYNHDNHVFIKKNERKHREDDFHGVFLNIVPSAGVDANIPFVENNILERMYYRSAAPSYPFVFRLMNSLLETLLYKIDSDNQTKKRYEDKWIDERDKLDCALFKTYIKILINSLQDALDMPETLHFPYKDQTSKFQFFNNVNFIGSLASVRDSSAVNSLVFENVDILEDGTFDLDQMFDAIKKLN